MYLQIYANKCLEESVPYRDNEISIWSREHLVLFSHFTVNMNMSVFVVFVVGQFRARSVTDML